MFPTAHLTETIVPMHQTGGAANNMANNMADNNIPPLAPDASKPDIFARLVSGLVDDPETADVAAETEMSEQQSQDVENGPEIPNPDADQIPPDETADGNRQILPDGVFQTPTTQQPQHGQQSDTAKKMDRETVFSPDADPGPVLFTPADIAVSPPSFAKADATTTGMASQLIVGHPPPDHPVGGKVHSDISMPNWPPAPRPEALYIARPSTTALSEAIPLKLETGINGPLSHNQHREPGIVNLDAHQMPAPVGAPVGVNATPVAPVIVTTGGAPDQKTEGKTTQHFAGRYATGESEPTAPSIAAKSELAKPVAPPLMSGPPLHFGQVAGDTAAVVDANKMPFQVLEAHHIYSTQAEARVQEIAVPKSDIPRHIARQMFDILQRMPDRPVALLLNPEELGRVRMAISTQDLGVVITVVTERVETLDLMRRHIDELAQEFHSLGFQNVEFSFAHGHGQGAQDTPDDQSEQIFEAEVEAFEANNTIINLSGEPSSGLDLRL